MEPLAAERSVSPGAGRASSLRGALLWGAGPLVLSALVLGVLLLRGAPEPSAAALATCEPSPLAVRHTRKAAQATSAGDFALARREVEAALAEAPCYAPALLVLASLGLEEGRAQEVENAVARLKTVHPERAEPTLLEQLLKARHGGGVAWRQAFLEAWTALGRPDFRGSPLLVEVEEAADDTSYAQAWRQATSPSVRLTLALAAFPRSEQQARWLLGQVPILEDAALLIAVDNVLREEDAPPALRQEAAPVLSQQLATLSRAHPRSMQLRLQHLLADTSPYEALSARDFEALEAAALLEWKVGSFSRTFQEARRHLEAAQVPNAGGAAFTVATLSITDRGCYLLRKRAEATRSGMLPGARHRLGRILHGVGARMATEPTLVERMVGLQLMQEGAADMQDEAESKRVDALLEEAHAALSAQQKAALERWPLPSLHEEVLEASASDEWAHLRDFAEPSPPGTKP